jgi:hypothetical protein
MRSSFIRRFVPLLAMAAAVPLASARRLRGRVREHP